MAKKQKNNKASNNSEIDNPLPEGFSSLNAQEMDGWFRPSPGAIIRGIFLGKFQGRGKGSQIKHYYQVELTARCQIQVRDDDGDWVEGMGEVGNIIGIDSKPGLRDLDTLLDADVGSQEVFIVARDKIELKSGNTMWRFAVGHRDAPRGFRAKPKNDVVTGADSDSDSDLDKTRSVPF